MKNLADFYNFTQYAKQGFKIIKTYCMRCQTLAKYHILQYFYY